MYRACLALVEAFGQHIEVDDDDAADGESEGNGRGNGYNQHDAVLARLPMNTRLQLAMQMQQLAAELHSQCHKLDSKLFQHFHSKLLATKLPDVAPVLVEFDGKSAATSPTLRAALLHVRRLQSHADQLYYLDETYSQLGWLHEQLARSSPEYQACCVGLASIQSLFNPSLPVAVTAVEGSVCATCWHGWNGTFLDGAGAENANSKKADNVTMYFLLGPVTLGQATSGGLENRADSSVQLSQQFPEPYLARVSNSPARSTYDFWCSMLTTTRIVLFVCRRS
jgi:hypothetical protein